MSAEEEEEGRKKEGGRSSKNLTTLIWQVGKNTLQRVTADLSKSRNSKRHSHMIQVEPKYKSWSHHVPPRKGPEVFNLILRQLSHMLHQLVNSSLSSPPSQLPPKKLQAGAFNCHGNQCARLEVLEQENIMNSHNVHGQSTHQR